MEARIELVSVNKLYDAHLQLQKISVQIIQPYVVWCRKLIQREVLLNRILEIISL